MLGWLRLMINKVIQELPAAPAEASAKAVGFVKQDTDCLEGGARLRADESDRWVFAVFYKGPIPARPMPYKVVAVTKDSRQASYLDGAGAAKYRLRGYK